MDDALDLPRQRLEGGQHLGLERVSVVDGLHVGDGVPVGASLVSLRRQWRTLTYAFVPKKAFERIPDASTPSRPLIRLL